MLSPASALHWLSLSEFIAGDLVFFEAMAASAVVAWVLARQQPGSASRYAVTVLLTTAVSLLLALIATSLVFITPIGVQHVTETTQNSFPSHHALLAALIVSAVLLVKPRTTLPFALVSVIVDLALILEHHHHPIDVLASTVFVLVGTLVSWRLEPALYRLRHSPLLSPGDAMRLLRRDDVMGGPFPERDPQSESHSTGPSQL